MSQQTGQSSHQASRLVIHCQQFDAIFKKLASFEQGTEANDVELTWKDSNEQLQDREDPNALNLSPLRQDLAELSERKQLTKLRIEFDKDC